MKHLDQDQIDYAVECAREHSTQYNTDSFSIHHLSTYLEVPYTVAKEMFYHHESSEESV